MHTIQRMNNAILTDLICTFLAMSLIKSRYYFRQVLNLYRVFEHSPTSKLLEDLMHVPTRMLGESFTILADKGFALCKEVITPFKPTTERPLTPEEADFNAFMNSKRQVISNHALTFIEIILSLLYEMFTVYHTLKLICFQTVERAFSLLKRRYKRVRRLNQKSHFRAVTVVMAACILHNISIFESDSVDYYLEHSRPIRRVKDKTSQSKYKTFYFRSTASDEYINTNIKIKKKQSVHNCSQIKSIYAHFGPNAT